MNRSLERFGLKSCCGERRDSGRACRSAIPVRAGALKTAFFYSLGTGIGGGIVAGGRLQQGSRGMAGEFGHMSIDYEGLPCACGQRGCVERMPSGPAIVYWARFTIDSAGVEATDFVHRYGGGRSLTASSCTNTSTGVMPLRCASMTLSATNWRGRRRRHYGVAPDRVVAWRGVMTAGQVIVDTVTKHLPRYSLPEMLGNCEIRAAQPARTPG